MDKAMLSEGLMNIAHGISVIAEALAGAAERLPEEAHQLAMSRTLVFEPPVSEPPVPPVSEPPAPPVSEPPVPPVSEPPAPPVSDKPPTREEVVSYFRGMSQVIGPDAAKAAVAKILANLGVKAFKDIPESMLGQFLSQLRAVPGAPANA